MDSYLNPVVLTDSIISLDGGQLLMSQYVDISGFSETWSNQVLVKGIEAKYSLAHSNTIRISSPHRYRDLGETLLQDDQEGKAQDLKEEYEQMEQFADERHEQEHALNRLGVQNVRLGPQNSTQSNKSTKTFTFGGGSWIFCTAIQPTSEDEWQNLHKALPSTYNDYTTIHQPRKFAQALGLMFLDQFGPNASNGKFRHNSKATKEILSLHDTLHVLHGPVLYTEDVYGLLNYHEDSAVAKMYPLFVKDLQYGDQQEYRFAVVGNDNLHNQWRDIVISGMMRDALLPVQRSSNVHFERSVQESGNDEAISTTPKSYTKRENQTRTKREQRTRTLTVNGEEVQRGVKTREVVLTVTTETVLSGDMASDLAVGEERHTGKVVQRMNDTTEVDGIPISTSKGEDVRIGFIESIDGADDYFSIEDKKEAEEVIEHAKTLAERASDSLELRTKIIQLFRAALDPAKENLVEANSAAWHGFCALVNLQSHFGDVVDKIYIEDQRFIAISLKRSPKSGASGKLLVGPRGTYAYLLRRGDESEHGYGGEESKLVLFPSEEDAEAFAEYGWLPLKQR